MPLGKRGILAAAGAAALLLVLVPLGAAAGADVTLSATSLTFADRPVGTSADAQTIQVTNTGDAPLTISAVHIDGADAGDFGQSTACPVNPDTVAVGATCSIYVSFAPHSAGPKTATLTLGDDAASSPQTVALSGGGVDAPPVPPAPVVGVNPTSLSLGSENVGTTSPAKTVSITDNGASPLTISGIDVTPDFAETSDCPAPPATLGAGATCSVSVTFTPSATGARNGTLTVTDDAAGSPRHVPLTGTGLAAGLYFSEDFESGSLGQWDALSSSDSTIAADSTIPNSGSGSVRFTNASNDQSSRLDADLAGGDHAQSYTRFCFRIGAGMTQGGEIANGRAITAIYPLGIRRWEITYNPVTKGLEGYFFNDALQRLDLYAANGRVLPDQWHCAELYLDESVDGRADLWLDGAPVGSVTGDLGTPDPYGRLYLWNQPSAGTVWFDDVRVASTPGGPVGAAVAGRPMAQAALAPSTLRFGAQTAATTSAPETVTLSNSGIGAMTISGIGVTDDFGQSNDCPTTLPAGASCSISVTFSPSATGPRAGTLTVNDDSPDGSQTVALSGIGLAPGTYLTDDFESGLSQWDALSSSGSTVAGDSSVANSGGSSVRIANASGDQSSRLMADLAGGAHEQSYTRFCFRIASGLTQGIEIANGRAITAEYPLGIRRWVVTYNPVTKGLEAYFFNEGLQRLDLYAGNGRVLAGRWYCAELYLDERANGSAQLWLDGVSIGSVSGDLSTPDPYSRLYLWNQPSAGTVWFDDVRVADSAIGPVGAGAADLPGPQVGLSPSSLTFASRTTQTSSAGQTVTLTNTGGLALTIGGIAVTGANAGDFAQTNNCPGQLAPGASCTATVTFTPTAPGARSASLTFTDDASGTPQTVALSGTGTAPLGAVPVLSPTSLAFGNQVRGTTSAPQSVTLSNTGNQTLTLAAAKIDQGTDFALASTNCFSGVAPGASCTLNVTFKPGLVGVHSANLVVSTNVRTVGVGLSGTGTYPAGTFLADDFESGFGAWARVGSGQLAPVAGHTGTAASLTNLGIYADFVGQPQTHTRFCFNTTAQGGGILAQGRDTTGASVWELDYDPGAHGLDIYVWNGAHVRTDLFAANVFGGSPWYCADVDFAQTAGGHFTLSVNGVQVAAASGDFSSANAYSRLLFWSPITVDDVSVTDS